MRYLAAILFLGAAFAMSAFGSEDAWNSANAAYKEGDYSESIRLYETILSGGGSSEVYYNLGNAYYKAGDHTRAILNYERALKLAPDDKDNRHNLDLANLLIVDKINAAPEFFLITWWKAFAMRLDADIWTILFLVMLWAGILALLSFAMLNVRFRGLLFASGLGALFLALILVLLALTRHQYETRHDDAIIMAPSVSVKSAPLTTGTDLFIIHEGLKVSVTGRDGEWLKISLPDGKEGWMPSGMAESI